MAEAQPLEWAAGMRAAPVLETVALLHADRPSPLAGVQPGHSAFFLMGTSGKLQVCSGLFHALWLWPTASRVAGTSYSLSSRTQPFTHSPAGGCLGVLAASQCCRTWSGVAAGGGSGSWVPATHRETRPGHGGDADSEPERCISVPSAHTHKNFHSKGQTCLGGKPN